MTAPVHYSSCPVCRSSRIALRTELKDHSVSGETFEIWECADCTLRFTQDVPASSEIGRYYQSDNYISHTDTEKGIINRLYHLVRKRTLLSKKAMVLRYSQKQNGALLDIGAGTGAFASVMQEGGWQVTALEPDPQARALAEKRHTIQLQEPSALFELKDDSIDVITLWHVLEHVHTLQEYLAQFKKIVRKGGMLLIAVPNYTAEDAKKYGHYWAAYDVPRHLYHFSPASMQALLRLHGLELLQMLPMWYDSFYVSMLSEKYKTGKQQLIKGIWSGMVSNWKAFKQRNRCSSLVYVVKIP